MEVSYSCWYLRIQVPFLPLERKKWAGRAGQDRARQAEKKGKKSRDASWQEVKIKAVLLSSLASTWARGAARRGAVAAESLVYFSEVAKRQGFDLNTYK